MFIAETKNVEIIEEEEKKKKDINDFNIRYSYIFILFQQLLQSYILQLTKKCRINEAL